MQGHLGDETAGDRKDQQVSKNAHDPGSCFRFFAEAFRSAIGPILAPQPRRGGIGFFGRGLLLQAAITCYRQEQKAHSDRRNKKSDGHGWYGSVDSRLAAIREKSKQGEQARDQKHQPETNQKSGCTLGGLGHTTSLDNAPECETGRRYRFVLVVTSN